jgi:heme oxygenase
MNWSRTLARLDAETRPHHGDASDWWLSLVTSGLTQARYQEQLVLVYGFESAVEAALACTPHPVGVDARSGFIAQDLIALGMRPAQIAKLAQCPIAPFASRDEALGWMYVVEFSTGLHEPIKLHVEARLPTAAAATAYLRATEGRLDERWARLAAALARYDANAVAQARIVDAAHEAFRAQLSWYSGGERLRSTGT